MTCPPPADSNDSSETAAEAIREVQFWIDHPSLDNSTVSELPGSQAAVPRDVDECWRLLGQRDSSMAEPAADHASPAEQSQGRYQALQVIGVGSFGVVFKARDRQLAREVALKILRPSVKLSQRARQRFALEGQLLARCGFEGLISIFEVGEFDEHTYLAMGLINGPNLADYLAETARQLPLKTSARLIQQIAQAIHRAHQAKILHRDLKPSNVLLARCEATEASDFPFRPVVSDFGLAKNFLPLVEREGQDASLETAIVGTVRYMSPEQAAGQSDAICEASDVYSLGVMLFELLTGSCPYTGHNKLEVLQAISRNPTPSPRGLNRSVPRELEAIVLKAMAKDRMERYASAEQLAMDLECWLRGTPTSARPAGKLKRACLWARRNPALTGALGVIACGILLSCVVFSGLYRRANRNLALALEAKRSLIRYAEETLQNFPNANQKKLELHLEALRFSEMYAKQNHFDEPSLYGLSIAHHYVGLAAINAEQFELGREHLETCLTMVERLSKRYPNNAKYRFDLFMNRYQIFVNFETASDLKSAELALADLKAAVALNPTNIDYQEALAAINRSIGVRVGGPLGRQLLREAVAVSRKLALANPEQPKFWKHAVGASMELAAFENSEQNFEEALRESQQALQYYAAYRDDVIAAQLCSLIDILQQKIRALEGLRDPTAVQVMEECARVCEQVEGWDTKYQYYRQVRGGLYLKIAQSSQQSGNVGASRRQLQQAIDTVQGYQPTLAIYESELAGIRGEIEQLQALLQASDE